jgi:DNA repair exonuclease SbcCD ATPase subunit
VIKHGKKTCKVELFIEGLHIIRSKGPERVVVYKGDVMYENDDAQRVILETIGVNYDITGYIQQNASNSFTKMSPTDKLGFLEKISLGDIDMVSKKKKCSSILNAVNTKLASATAQLTATKELFDKMNEPENVEFPYDCKKEERKDVVKSDMKMKKQIKETLEKSKLEISKLRDAISSAVVKENTLKIKREELKELTDEKNGIHEEQKKINDAFIGEKKLEEYKNQLRYLREENERENLKQKIKESEEQYEKIKKEQLEKFEEEIRDTEADLWKDGKKDGELEDLKDLCADLMKYKEHSDNIVDYDTEKIDENKRTV